MLVTIILLQNKNVHRFYLKWSLDFLLVTLILEAQWLILSNLLKQSVVQHFLVLFFYSDQVELDECK
jgi:hypothetical protein